MPIFTGCSPRARTGRGAAIAQAVHAQKLDRGPHRPVELEAHPGRRFMRRRVGYFELAGRHRELPPGRQIGRGLGNHNLCVAAGDAHGEVGVVERVCVVDGEAIACAMVESNAPAAPSQRHNPPPT